MVGHSKWSKVKHIKGPPDVKHGAARSKPVKEITVAADSGDDLSGSPCPCPVTEIARPVNMLKNYIERASKKGTGELVAAHHEGMLCGEEAPGGVIRLLETGTENKNRTATGQRFTLSKHHGSFAASGSGSHQSCFVLSEETLVRLAA